MTTETKTGLYFCTTEPHCMFEFGDALKKKMTAPEDAFGERYIGYVRGPEMPCNIAMRGYLHGDVELAAKFDIPVMCQGEILLDTNETIEQTCGVWVNPGEVRDCIIVAWPEQKFILWIGNSGTNHSSIEEAHNAKMEYDAKMVGRNGGPEVRIEQVFHYLIVQEDDSRSLKYARQCAIERKTML